MQNSMPDDAQSGENNHWFDTVLEFFGELGINLVIEFLGSLF